MAIKHHIRLSNDEQKELNTLIKNPKVAKYKRDHAQILIGLDENGPALKANDVAKMCAVTIRTVENVRKRCVEEGIELAVHSKFGHHGRPRKMDGEQQAHLVALTCSEPPEGQVRWTLNLLKDEMIKLEYIDSVSVCTIGRELKKTNLNLGSRKNGASQKKKMLNL